jgi:hypothetical protein
MIVEIQKTAGIKIPVKSNKRVVVSFTGGIKLIFPYARSLHYTLE